MKYCITFAGVIGSSKTPIAYYLSQKLGLPIFNNDAIRTEILEEVGQVPQEMLIQRRNERLGALIAGEKSFICDASVDREWSMLKTMLTEHGFKYLIISIDLPEDFIRGLYQKKSYTDSLKALDENYADHQQFLEQYGDDVGVHITEEDFGVRLAKSYEAVQEWIVSNE